MISFWYHVFLFSFHWTLGWQASGFLLSWFLVNMFFWNPASRISKSLNFGGQGTRLTNHLFQTPFVDGWDTFSGMARKPPENESKPLCRLVGMNPKLQPVPIELARTIWLTTDEPLFWRMNSSVTPRNGFTTDIRAIFSNTVSRLSSHIFDIGAVF